MHFAFDICDEIFFDESIFDFSWIDLKITHEHNTIHFYNTTREYLVKKLVIVLIL